VTCASASPASAKELAKRWGVTPSQLAIGWVLAKKLSFVPTLGMRTAQQLDEALAAKPLSAG
jgi:aryl-alcohol dehydrogenase-like predicted oxidoreductase